jgi:hypothetical protein
MTRYVTLSSILVASAMATGLFADPPENPPTDWRGLQIGMSFNESVACLGDLAFRQPSAEEQRLATALARAPLSVPLLRSDAAAHNKQAKETDTALPQDVERAITVILKAKDSRGWTSRSNINSRGRPQRVSGRLETVAPHAAPPTIEIQQSGGKAVTLPIADLDPTSQKFLAEFIEAATFFKAHRDKAEKALLPADKRPSIDKPADLSIRNVVEFGVSFQPELVFLPHLSLITLRADEPKRDGSTFEKLARAMSEKFGKPNSVSTEGDERVQVWLFPEITVSLKYSTKEFLVPVYVQQYTSLPRGRIGIAGREGAESHTAHNITIQYMAAGVRRFGESNLLGPGEKLQQGEFLVANKRGYWLTLTQEGDLLLCDRNVLAPLWASKTAGRGVTELVVGENGSLALITSEGARVWETKPPREGAAFLFVQDDGNLCLYADRSASAFLMSVLAVN